MMRSERGRALVSALPLDRILTETDGPFTQNHGRPAEPADVQETAADIAGALGLPVDAVCNAVRENLQAILR